MISSSGRTDQGLFQVSRPFEKIEESPYQVVLKCIYTMYLRVRERLIIPILLLIFLKKSNY
jgi:hypothetical protein